MREGTTRIRRAPRKTQRPDLCHSVEKQQKPEIVGHRTAAPDRGDEARRGVTARWPGAGRPLCSGLLAVEPSPSALLVLLSGVVSLSMT